MGMAGGDEALFVSQELVEDDPAIGASDLNDTLVKLRKTNKNGKIVFIGITCGLSAPYVAGQIKHALDNESDYSAIGLIGHNPPDLARDDKIENWPHGTFRSVLRDLKKSNRAMIMTPVMGGETITGSSRMKGGSGTLIVLQTAFLCALENVVKRTGTIQTSSIS